MDGHHQPPGSEVRRFSNPKATWLWVGMVVLAVYSVGTAGFEFVAGQDPWLAINALIVLPWIYRMWLALHKRTEIRAGSIHLNFGRLQRDIPVGDVHKVTSSPYGPVTVHLSGGESLVLPSVQPEDAPEVRRLIALPAL